MIQQSLTSITECKLTYVHISKNILLNQEFNFAEEGLFKVSYKSPLKITCYTVIEYFILCTLYVVSSYVHLYFKT